MTAASTYILQVIAGYVKYSRKKSRDERTLSSARKEKHIPVISPIGGGFKVKVGEVLHPSTPEHYIEWIEIIADGKAYRQFLKPGDTPEAVFTINAAQVSMEKILFDAGAMKFLQYYTKNN